ncbi:MAG: hypothetical protein M1838_001774 [Thelocarpon superellum]|nr:MAG: hypothetical protein M1838_001774 [Thelocarpon superellum]
MVFTDEDSRTDLWFWFPFGAVGIRTLLLFISALAIFILRVAQLHIGARTTPSPFQSLRAYLIRYNTFQTVGWYFFSAWWFSEVYMWSAAKDPRLMWVLEGKAHERPRLNEQPIYLRSFFFMLATMQSMVHLYEDYDRLPLPIDANAIPTPTIPVEQLRAVLPRRAQKALLRSLSMVVMGPIIYSLFLRASVWGWSLYVTKMFWSLPRSSSTPPLRAPYHISLLWRSAGASFFLMLLWEMSNAIFNVFAAQQPLKRGQPLTEDSRDPNGSLLIGLRAKKEVPKAFAFWELCYISQRPSVRRASFFEDLDRTGGTTWSQVLDLCLDVVGEVNSRIGTALKPPAPPEPEPVQAAPSGNPQPLPRLTPPLKEGPIFSASPRPSSRPEMVQSTVGSMAKSLGQTPASSPNGPRLSPRVKRAVGSAVNQALPAGMKHALSQDGWSSTVKFYVLQFLQSSLGAPFQQTLQRRSAAIVLGTPYGDMGMVMHAVDALAKLGVSSLKEDPYGNVATDVPIMIRTFVSTIGNLNKLKVTLTPHWTDVNATGPNYRDHSFEEVDCLLGAVQEALAQLVHAFASYADTMGLSRGEMRLAREAADMDSDRD